MVIPTSSICDHPHRLGCPAGRRVRYHQYAPQLRSVTYSTDGLTRVKNGLAGQKNSYMPVFITVPTIYPEMAHRLNFNHYLT